MPNPWNAGSAKRFASLGFEAMATTSQGLANPNPYGRVDGTLAVSREEVTPTAASLLMQPTCRSMPISKLLRQ